jgi:hypothetical protein
MSGSEDRRPIEGILARVTLSVAGHDRYFTTINCKPWQLVGWS